MNWLRLFVFVLLLSFGVQPAVAGTCYGLTPCDACKTCEYCKHCAKRGGTCGVYVRGSG